MLSNIAAFFKKEKIYVLFTALVMVFYAYLWFGKAHHKITPTQDRPAVQEFEKAERKMQEKTGNTEAFRKYLKKNPQLEMEFGLLSLLILTAFLIGLVLDGFLLCSPKRRRMIENPLRTEDATPWRLSMLFKVIILFLLGAFLISFLLGIVKHIFPGFSDNAFVLLHTTLADFFCFGVILWIVRENSGSWRDLGFRVPDGKVAREVLYGLGAYSAILPIFGAILIVLVYISNLLAYEPPPHPLVAVFLEEEKRSPQLIIYSVFLATVLGPVFEEIFFRGFCYPILKKKVGVRAAMVLSSALFALIHDNTFAFWPIFILGMGLCYIYEKRGSILSPIVLHITHNSIFIAYFFVAKNFVGQEMAILFK